MRSYKPTIVNLIIILVLIILITSPVKGETLYTFEESPFAQEIYKGISFSDLEGHWAATPIYRMAAQSVLRGYDNGKFRPNSPLTREEALALVIRMAGHDEEAQVTAEVIELELNQNPATVENLWARGYLQVAANRGIITPWELEDIEASPNKAAQRQNVAAWLSRALGLTAIYGPEQQLIYSFKDWRSFNPELFSAIEPFLQKGWMGGYPDGSFKPAAPILRGEMAAVLDRISSEEIERRGWSILKGFVLGKKNYTIFSGDKQGQWYDVSIQLAGSNDEALISHRAKNSFPVLREGRIQRATTLNPGEEIEVFLDIDDRVVFAQGKGKRTSSLIGYLVSVNTEDGSLQLQDPYDHQLRSFSISPKVGVIMDGRQASLQDLIKGQELQLDLTNNQIVSIKGNFSPPILGYEEPKTFTKIGRIKEVLGDYLTITENGVHETYLLTSKTNLRQGRRPITPTSLKIGDWVRLQITNNEITLLEIDAYQGLADTLIKGQLNTVFPESNKISLLNPKEYFYGQWYPIGTLGLIELDRAGEVYLGGQAISLDELRRGYLGDEVYLAISNTKGSPLGAKVLVRRGESRPYNGIIDQVAWILDRFSLTKQEVNFLTDSGTIALRNGKLVDPDDFKIGDHVFLETIYTPNGEYSALMEYFEGIPNQYRIFAGRINRIDRRSLEMRNSSQLVENKWQDIRRTTNLTFDNNTQIWDAWLNENWLSPDELAESRWSDEYLSSDAFVIADENNKALAMSLRWWNPNILKTSIGRVVSVNAEENYLKLDRIQDWSEGYRRWTPNPEALELDLSDTLIYNGVDFGRVIDLKPGQTVYLIHDQFEACFLFIQ